MGFRRQKYGPKKTSVGQICGQVGHFPSHYLIMDIWFILISTCKASFFQLMKIMLANTNYVILHDMVQQLETKVLVGQQLSTSNQTHVLNMQAAIWSMSNHDKAQQYMAHT